MREIITTSILKEFNQKKQFCGEVLLQLRKIVLALGIDLKFYTSVENELKVKIRKFWGVIFTFLNIIGKKLVAEAF